MTEATVETFKQAAFEAGRRLRGEGTQEALEVKESLRERIQAILTEGEIVVDDSTRDISTRVAESLLLMLWPEKGLEVKKKKAELKVERSALIEYIKETLREQS